MAVNLPDEVREVISDLMDENEKLKNRVAELEDLLSRQTKNKSQKRRRTNKRDWLEADDEDDE